MKKSHVFLFVLFLWLIAEKAIGQNGLNFVGTSSSGNWVNTNQPPLTGNSARTVEAWIKMSSATSTTQQVILDMGSTATGGRFTLNVISGQYLRIEIGGNGFSGTTDITDNNWHHVAVTYNPSNTAGQKAKLYVDGVLETQADFTVTMNISSSSNIRIGCRVDAVNYFTGTIDEVRVWNMERTASEIASNYSQEFCSAITGLIAYYKFNEGVAGGTNTSITTLTNTANSLYSGTLYGFTKTGTTSNFVTSAPIVGRTFFTINPIVCTSYTVPSNKRTYTVSGTYYDTLINTIGCDSIITINLAVVASSPMTGLMASNITSSDALLTWKSVTGVSGYEYVVSSSATPPVSGTYTNDTFHNATGLIQGTTYYLHVRAYCGSGNTGFWATIMFETLPACYAVTGLTISNITTTNATFNWDADPDALWFEYIITYTPSSPPPSLGGSGTYKNHYAAYNLYPGKTFYFHLRKKCKNNILAPWITEIFSTLPATTSLSDLEHDEISISPNPATDVVSIELPTTAKQSKIVVTDVLGNQLKTNSFRQNTIKLDLNDLPNGIFFLHIVSDNNHIVKKIIIRK